MMIVPTQLINKWSDKFAYFSESQSPVASVTEGMIPVILNNAFLVEPIELPTATQVTIKNNAVSMQSP
jgi:hypothetical protein